MKKFAFYPSSTAILLSILTWVSSTHGQTVTWQALPFPSNSDWPGPFGQPAVISSNSVVLRGRPARSVESFSGPLTIDFDVSVQARTTPDGDLAFSFIPLGVPLNIQPVNSTVLLIHYDNNASDWLAVIRSNQFVWGTVPFSVVAGHTDHVTFGVTAGGALSLSVNGQSYSLPSSIVVPSSPFQLQMLGWQPNDVWTVTNFTVVPEPSTVALVGVSLVGLATLVRRRK